MKAQASESAISPGAELHAESSNSVRAVKAENKPLVESAFISVECYHNCAVFVEHQARSSTLQKLNLKRRQAGWRPRTASEIGAAF
jgi:hypothetical protein